MTWRGCAYVPASTQGINSSRRMRSSSSSVSGRYQSVENATPSAMPVRPSWSVTPHQKRFALFERRLRRVDRRLKRLHSRGKLPPAPRKCALRTHGGAPHGPLCRYRCAETPPPPGRLRADTPSKETLKCRFHAFRETLYGRFGSKALVGRHVHLRPKRQTPENAREGTCCLRPAHEKRRDDLSFLPQDQGARSSQPGRRTDRASVLRSREARAGPPGAQRAATVPRWQPDGAPMSDRARRTRTHPSLPARTGACAEFPPDRRSLRQTRTCRPCARQPAASVDGRWRGPLSRNSRPR